HQHCLQPHQEADNTKSLLSPELPVAERWYDGTVLEDLLGVPLQKINDSRLYRGLDVLLEDKDPSEGGPTGGSLAWPLTGGRRRALHAGAARLPSVCDKSVSGKHRMSSSKRPFSRGLTK